MTKALAPHPGISIATLSIYVCFFILTLIPASTVFAQNIEGKLFTTAYEREYLDYLRRESQAQRANSGFDIENIPPPIIVEATDEIVQEAQVFYTLGGIVERSENTYSLWLNEQLLTEEQLPENFTVI